MDHRKIASLVVVLSFLVGACGYGDDEGQQASPGPTFEPATVIIETDDGPVMVYVEVAATEEERARGLMERKSLGEDEGMLFIYFEPSSGGFWMKNTLIPLSIAFFDRDGKILEILDMNPCRKDPCKIYNPGVEYMGALEVNRGAFEEWGVEEGDVVETNV